ncbi:hypothetical protein SAMD00019534_000790 [Acytostelium subglobosum LB1]|uniref:hypothetical protein n=1 Tax=Acytostelium subglobosum LB1 TaxID=1410327 RepID=UPI000644CD60|nr:hypothetical protein SAMD00019534_000790 [Acytostelium subglobosum LB1]GAM16904.1 hypothetical protein SAMD00019534_000790 [Acytostelium subglobosum LB1]|eukprot:XP_012758966.1 hypothetical protein SAMD00019534_000790 [Acytostelium subglobosum LB1]
MSTTSSSTSQLKTRSGSLPTSPSPTPSPPLSTQACSVLDTQQSPPPLSGSRPRVKSVFLQGSQFGPLKKSKIGLINSSDTKLTVVIKGNINGTYTQEKEAGVDLGVTGLKANGVIRKALKNEAPANSVFLDNDNTQIKYRIEDDVVLVIVFRKDDSLAQVTNSQPKTKLQEDRQRR